MIHRDQTERNPDGSFGVRKLWLCNNQHDMDAINAWCEESLTDDWRHVERPMIDYFCFNSDEDATLFVLRWS
ncbi:MAG: hypothetical protein EOO77_28115 [Oxalobacteraceae bacterium]|nr:MAG: hypothetical protein EOO77_28115 [Oxalobacteraceae bacterium]